MHKKNLLALAFLAAFIVAVIGCEPKKEVIQENQKVGLTPQERKEKRGE